MNRLQKKCLVATAGSHLLLVVALLCSGFIKSKPQPEDAPLITLIPDTVLDAMTSSPPRITPKPTPPETKPPEPTPPPVHDDPPPTPVKHVDPVDPVPLDKVNDPDMRVMVKPPVKPKQAHVINPVMDKTIVKNNKPSVTKLPVEDTTAQDEAREAAREKKRIHDATLKAFANATSNISKNLSSATDVSMPDPGSVSFASYASVVKSIYEARWQAPDDAANDEAVAKVSVTIARDGRVVESHVINSSGDAKVDASVRRTLNNVRFIKAFPADATESEKTFIINFNLQAKKSFG